MFAFARPLASTASWFVPALSTIFATTSPAVLVFTGSGVSASAIALVLLLQLGSHLRERRSCSRFVHLEPRELLGDLRAAELAPLQVELEDDPLFLELEALHRRHHSPRIVAAKSAGPVP